MSRLNDARTVKALIALAMLALAILAVGHTQATLGRNDTNDAKVLETSRAMEETIVPKTAETSPRSMADFNLGANLALTLALLASIGSLGILLRYVDTQPSLVRALLWPVLLYSSSMAIASHVYFFAIPAVSLCLLAALFLGLALWRLRRA